MLVIAISAFGYLLLAITFIIDKYILSSAKQPPVVYTVYSTVSLLLVLLALPFGVSLLPTAALWWWAIISGVTFAFALWAMFVALEHGEATHIQPFLGVWIVIATVALSRLFLAEQLSTMQWLGIVVLLLSAILLSFEKTAKMSGIHIGYVWAMLAGVFYGISHVSAKVVYEMTPFITGFFWTRLFIVPLGLLLLIHPYVHKQFVRDRKKKTASSTLAFIIASKVLAAIAVVLIQYAISLGSVSIVNALAGLQYTMLFVIVFLLTKFSPRVFKEFFTRQEITVQLLALVLVAVGLYLFTL